MELKDKDSEIVSKLVNGKVGNETNPEENNETVEEGSR